ncbi:YfbK domain-containing protein [Olivibacter domesticus]|uniref:Ca-activated chloride channel family protein n=1 Tax=Olivibacter domesticus TaxID=407022 RepID=A0A1H7LWV6_OLID1|nr:von Willebrand factor type A domain-containing protein [Olivibacter domesticus]SEL03424.1 Ca-activated chloride channel family protein [Olivibacter domesticus]
MKTYFSLVMLLLILVGFRADDYHTTSGTVYDTENNRPLQGVTIKVEGTHITTTSNNKGKYMLNVPNGATHLLFSMIGFESKRVRIEKTSLLDVWLDPSNASLEETVIVDASKARRSNMRTATFISAQTKSIPRGGLVINRHYPTYPSTESYKKISENGFIDPKQEPLSTFAIDVDAASYSNVRRFINNGQLPPKDAVRLEEMINYFQYNLAAPNNNDPVAIHTELSSAPWNVKHHLLRIGLKAKTMKTDKLPPSNFVFLLDVSGSMSDFNRLPLVKTSMKLLVDQLRDKDHVAIVTYAGSAEIKLTSTAGNNKIKIKDAIDALEANGSTAGGAGIKLAYRLAKESFIKEGNNRIILASDGDFNVGPSSDADMEELVANERQSGISLSVLGFGMGNLKDSKMETLANKGHGNYAYIDNLAEARKAMVTEFGSTLFTVAKDVKMQVEFNPAKVQAYRLLGYENRLLEKEDFNNDQKMGGDMGVGHTVTALYEIIPAGIKDDYVGNVDPLKYQSPNKSTVISNSTEMATIKFRYKNPESEKSNLKKLSIAAKPVSFSETSEDFKFTSAVAEFGLLLRNSAYKQQAAYDGLITRAKKAKGIDEEGYRAEFIKLAENTKLLAKSNDITQGNN